MTKTQKLKKFLFNKWTISVTLLKIASLAVTIPLFLKFRESSDHFEKLDKARAIYTQMLSFNRDYETLPSLEAVEIDDELAGFDLTSSNGYFGQLIAATNMTTEAPFFLEGSCACTATPPDNIVAPRSETLKAGENGWAYFKGRKIDSQSAPQPLLVPGWNPATKQWDDALWSEGIPVLSTDGAITLYKAQRNDSSSQNIMTKSDLPFAQNDLDLIQPSHPN